SHSWSLVVSLHAHRYLHSFPTRRSSDLQSWRCLLTLGRVRNTGKPGPTISPGSNTTVRRDVLLHQVDQVRANSANHADRLKEPGLILPRTLVSCIDLITPR